MRTSSKNTYFMFNDMPNKRNSSYCNFSKAKKFYPIYGLFCEDDGIIYGYIENSFSMEWSRKHVRGWNLKDAQSYLDRYISNSEKLVKSKTKNVRYFIYRLTRKSENAMIIADFEERNDAIALNGSSFYRRNIPFKVKQI